MAEVNVEATISSLEQHQPAYLPVEQQLARLEGLCAQTVLPLCYDQYKSLYRYTHHNCTCLCAPQSSLCQQMRMHACWSSCCWWVRSVLHARLLLSLSHCIALSVTPAALVFVWHVCSCGTCLHNLALVQYQGYCLHMYPGWVVWMCTACTCVLLG